MRKSLGTKAWEAARTLATRRIEFSFENLPVRIAGASWKKIFNWLVVEASIAAGTTRAWGMPTHVHIEPSSKCNQRCLYCPVGQELSGPTGHLDLETFKKLADAQKGHALLYEFWGWGEPFLNEQVYAMIRYARELGIRTVSSTNGQLFERKEAAEAVVESGLDLLIVSVSGVSQETYGRFRPGSKWEKVAAGVKNVTEAKKRLGSRTPLVSLTYIVSRENEHETGEVERVARELGVDAYSLKRLNPTSTRTARWNGDEHVASDSRFVRLEYENGERKRVKKNPCKALWQGGVLRWDGAMTPCAYDFHSKRKMGDLGKQEFVEIWQGGAYRGMREQFREKYEEIEICRDCTYAFVGGNYEDVFAEKVFLNGGR
jgi:radical SAM protein with 4Fe4S-binding SPASM domain